MTTPTTEVPRSAGPPASRRVPGWAESLGGRDRLARALVPAAVLLGLAIRIREYAFNRSLWLDEAYIGNDILHTGFAGLLKPLAQQQAAPVGWLWVERATVDAFGSSEASLRLWPFVASLVLVVVTPLVARRLMSAWGVAVATFLVAVSPQLIYYSSELKPYSSDTLCVLLVVLLLSTDGIWESYRSGALAAAGLAAIGWYSFPAIPVTAVGLIGLLALRARRSANSAPAGRRAVRTLAGAAILVGVSDLVEYLVNLRQVSKSRFLTSYWRHAGGFAPSRGGVGGFLSWLWNQPARVLAVPGRLTLPDLALGLVLLGVLALARRPDRRRRLALLLCAPVVGVVGGALSVYPLADRVALWLVPVALILLGGFLELPLGTRWWRLLLVIPVAVVSGSSVVAGLDALPSPLQNNDARGAFAFVARHEHPGDRVLLDVWAGPTWKYYGPRYHLQMAGVFQLVASPPGSSCPVPPTLVSPVLDRLWVVFNHHGTGEAPDSTAVYMRYLGRFGRITESWQGYGGSAAYLLVLDHRVPPPAGQPHWWLPHACLKIAT